jgi:hypothetical protein
MVAQLREQPDGQTLPTVSLRWPPFELRVRDVSSAVSLSITLIPPLIGTPGSLAEIVFSSWSSHGMIGR